MAGIVKKRFAGPGSYSIVVPAGVRRFNVEAIRRMDPFKKANVNGGSSSDQIIGMTAGAIHVIGDGDQIYTWGVNTSGQFGNSGLTNTSSPVLVTGTGDGVTPLQISQITGVAGQTWALTKLGSIYAWGISSATTRLGTGETANVSVPTIVLNSSTKYQKIWGTGFGCFALDKQQNMWAWGGITSDPGFMGLGHLNPQSSPALVLGGRKFVDVVTDAQTTFFFEEDGTVYATGLGSMGNRGDGLTTNVSSPVLACGGMKFRKIASTSGGVAGSAWLGLTHDGDVYSWGDNNFGSLGVGDDDPRSTPTLVIGSGPGGYMGRIVEVGGALGNFYAINDQGQLYCWGAGAAPGWGNLPISGTNNSSSPVLATGISGGPVRKLFLYTRASFALVEFDSGHALFAWGSNTSGACGVGHTNEVTEAELVVGDVADWLYVGHCRSQGSVFGVDVNGDLYAWGENSVGQLGVGDTTDRSSPTLVVGGIKAKVVDEIFRQTVDVVPGETLDINVFRFYAKVGNTIVSEKPVDEIVISYEL